MVYGSGCSTLACGAVISHIPNFLDDRLLFCCWPPEGVLFVASWEVPVPAPSIFSISFSTIVPFYNSHKLGFVVMGFFFFLRGTSILDPYRSLLRGLTMANDCGDNGPSGWLVGTCGGAGGGGFCWLEILRLAIRSSNSVVA